MKKSLLTRTYQRIRNEGKKYLHKLRLLLQDANTPLTVVREKKRFYGYRLEQKWRNLMTSQPMLAAAKEELQNSFSSLSAHQSTAQNVNKIRAGVVTKIEMAVLFNISKFK